MRRTEGACMRWDILYEVAGDAFLAQLPPETSRETPFGRVTLHHEAGEDPVRLVVTPNASPLPAAQGQPTPAAESAAGQIRETDDWVAVVEMADVHLRGTPTELRCSITI